MCRCSCTGVRQRIGDRSVELGRQDEGAGIDCVLKRAVSDGDLCDSHVIERGVNGLVEVSIGMCVVAQLSL